MIPMGWGYPPSMRASPVLHQFFPDYFHFQRCINSQTDLCISFHYAYFYGVFGTGEGNNNGFAFAASGYEHGNLLLPERNNFLFWGNSVPIESLR